MWRWIFVILLALNATSTQPIFDHDGRECCPCPKPTQPKPDLEMAPSLRSNMDDCPCRNDAPWPGADQQLAGTAEDAFVRAGAVDDCPCRFRDADPLGAPSGFLPTAVRALWTDVSDKDNKEDPKPLLHPEVGLASSVLETLREATDEEYEEALARDAVRNAQAPDIDVMSDVSSALDTARNIVNVILKPNESPESTDDNDSEASHVQESRCIHPLGRSNRLNLQYSPTTVNEIYTLPKKEPALLLHKNKNIWDMDSSVGASDFHEKIIDGTSNGFEGFKLKSNPSLFGLFPGSNNDPGDQFKFKTMSNFKETENPLDALNRKVDNSITDLKQKLDGHLQTIKSDNANKLKTVLDSVNSPSTTKITFKPLVPTTNFEQATVKPFSLKSLLKLKDVELVPPIKTSKPDLNNAKFDVPELLPSLNKNNKESTIDLFKNFKTTDLGNLITNGLKISFENNINQRGTENIQPIRKGIFKSGILDAETSPSEITVNTDHGMRKNNDCEQNIRGSSFNLPQNTKNTQILEKLPKGSEINEQAKPSNEESISENMNDLSQNVNNIPKTEIIDTVPESSNISPMQSDDDLNANSEGFDGMSRQEGQCESDINDREISENNFESDSQENRSDIDGVNAPIESNEEEREQDSEPNCLEEPVIQEDSESKTSNNSPTLIESDTEQRSGIDQIENGDDCVKQNLDNEVHLDEEHESEKRDFKNLKPLIKKKSMTEIKEDILKKLEKLKKPKSKVIFVKNKDATTTNQNNISEDKICDEKQDVEFKSENDIKPENKSDNTLDIQDLQNMSDKLLDLSNQRDQDTFASENIECNLPKIDNVPKEIVDPIEEKSDTTSSENIDSTEDNDDVTETSEISEDINSSDENETAEQKTACNVDYTPKSNAPFKENINNEMTADGSDAFINKISPEKGLTSSLHYILHPKDLNIGSTLQETNLKLGNILDLKLPRLENVKENLASIFQPKNNMNVHDEESIANESNSMSVDASVPTFKSVLPTLQPFEDINLDIFQMKPLTLPDPHEILSKVSSLPRLNLNSYKAKLAVPKGLKIKPMKLESSMGGKNGLFGATLTVGSDKGPFEKWPSVLRGPMSLNNLPTLEELHSNMRESAQNLLATPLDITGRNILDDSLRSSQTLTDNFRSHAKNTMKDIQQTLQTTLKDVEQSDLNILANPLRDPQEFFHAVSRTHEDMSDKLKAIHYDLNDRLESIRDRFTDQSLLPSLNSPLMRHSSFTFGPEKLKHKSAFPSSSKPQKKLKATSKSRPNSNSRVSSSRSKPVKSKTFKMPAAHSVPVPKTVQAPKLTAVQTSSPPPFVMKHPSFRTSPFTTNKKSMTNILPEPVSRFRDSKIPLLGKYKPHENKVKITFGTTTLSPELSRNKPSLASRFNDRPTVPRKPMFSSKLLNPTNSGAPHLGSISKSSDANVAPSEMMPTKLKAPLEDFKKNPSLTIPKKPLPELPRPKSLLKAKPHMNDRFINSPTIKPLPSIDKPSLGFPRDNLADSLKLETSKNLDILASLREAVKARLSNITPLSNDKIVQPDSVIGQQDMLRSASENVANTNMDGVMKENASYTCKMMCTRNN